jgi:hypothetical protein
MYKTVAKILYDSSQLKYLQFNLYLKFKMKLLHETKTILYRLKTDLIE